MNILWLGDSNCQDVLLVGGKAANLSRLVADFCVPPGFCVSSDVHKAASGGGLTHNTTHNTMYNTTTIPATLRDEITAAYTQLARRCRTDEPPVAVRSSGVGEDSNSAAFAGVHETYLNVKGASHVIRAVADCWASAYSPAALLYRGRQGIEDEHIRIAVVVQQLIPADISAVVFSANPVTGSRDEVMINASWGLGESIVGGTVTPDTYVVRKPGIIVLRDIADKECMTVLAEEGTREVEVPDGMRRVPALADEQIIEMARLAENLEQVMGWPVDLECAYYQGQLYLLQCRAITTLK